MQRSNEFFATANPLKLFFTVAIPGMISMLAASIYSLAEGFFIGNILGEAAFAAVNIAMPVIFINFSLADLVGVGSSAPIAIALGKKDEAQANNIFTSSVIMIFSAAALMGAILYFASPALVSLMGAEGELAEDAISYIRVYALLGPLTTVVFAMDNYLRICGFVKISMFLNILMTALTVLFIYLFLGVFKMNIAGSALATCISMMICALLAFIPFFLKRTVLRFVRPRFSSQMIKQIVACGSPVFLNNISGRVAAIVMNAMLIILGGQTAVAAYAVLMYSGSIVEPILYGMCDSVQPAVGYNWGAGKLSRVRDVSKCSFIACGIVSVSATVLVFIFARPLADIFIQDGNTALLDMSERGLRIFCTAYLFRWLGFAAQGFFSAIEKPLPATVLSVLSACVFPLVFMAALYPLALDGIWLNTTATSLALAIVALIMLISFQKRLAKKSDLNRFK